MKKLFLFIAAALVSTSMWAEDYVWNFSNHATWTYSSNDKSVTLNSYNGLGNSATESTSPIVLTYQGASTSDKIESSSNKFTVGETEYTLANRLWINGASSSNRKLSITGLSGTGTMILVGAPSSNRYVGMGTASNNPSSNNDAKNVALLLNNAQTKVTSTHIDTELSSSTTYYINVSGGYPLYALIWTPDKTISTQTLAGVKVGGAALTEDAATSGYSISSTTITLSNDILYIATPSNITLTNHVVYTDASSEDKNVTVTFDGTITAGYYIGTASIGASAYTVRAKQNVSPAIELSATSGSIAIANSYTVVDSITVTLTGANLTNGTYDVTASVAGTTISPTSFTVSDGVVSQEFKMISSASSAASTVFTFGTSAMGIAAPTYTLSYSRVAQRDLSQTDVTASTTWDWANAGSSEVLLTEKGKDKATADTDPKRGTDFLLAKLPEIDNDGDFNSQALLVNCQYPNRGGYFQGSKVVFTTTVPGKVKVIYSNTGSKNGTRYVIVNETVDTSGSSTSKSGNDRTSDEIAVSAGTVTITAKQIKDAEETLNAMLQISKIIFTKDDETAIDNTADETKAVKRIVNGQIFIEKNGHVYNVLGGCVK